MIEFVFFLAILVGVVLVALIGGSTLGGWLAVRRAVRAGIKLAPGSLLDRYQQILDMDGLRRNNLRLATVDDLVEALRVKGVLTEERRWSQDALNHAAFEGYSLPQQRRYLTEWEPMDEEETG